MRESPPTSGWNDVAISGPCRTATILPAAGPWTRRTRASTSTPSPDRLDPGRADERRVHRFVEPGEVDVALEGVDLAAERVAAHRDVDAADGLLAGAPSSMRSASRIMPAQVPNAGIPAAILERSGSISSKIRASLAIVVDSPPGRTSPSTAASSDSRRTATGRAPRSSEHAQVLADVALQGEHTDDGSRHGRRLVPLHALSNCGTMGR